MSGSGSDAGCASVLGFIGVVALAAWGFLDYAPKDAVVLGFQVWLVILVGVVAALVAGGVVYVGGGALLNEWSAWRSRRARRKWDNVR
jgi:hypothetical protein